MHLPRRQEGGMMQPWLNQICSARVDQNSDPPDIVPNHPSPDVSMIYARKLCREGFFTCNSHLSYSHLENVLEVGKEFENDFRGSGEMANMLSYAWPVNWSIEAAQFILVESSMDCIVWLQSLVFHKTAERPLCPRVNASIMIWMRTAATNQNIQDTACEDSDRIWQEPPLKSGHCSTAKQDTGYRVQDRRVQYCLCSAARQEISRALTVLPHPLSGLCYGFSCLGLSTVVSFYRLPLLFTIHPLSQLNQLPIFTRFLQVSLWEVWATPQIISQ